jgi:NADH-quinone oxidoreductase subunit K
MIPLSWYLYFAALLFCTGLFGVLARKNAIAILMGVELMLNAVNINLVAFWRYRTPTGIAGQAFAVIAVYRRRNTIAADQIDLMKW